MYDGLRVSELGAAVLELVVGFVGTLVVAVDVNGAKVFFMRANMLLTKPSSPSSSSEKGLNEVRLVLSSFVSFVLLRYREDWVLNVPSTGEESWDVSMAGARPGSRYLWRLTHKDEVKSRLIP